MRTCLHCEICGDLPASNAILGLAFACDACCSETRQATPPLAPRSHCQDCHDTDNAGQWSFGLDGRRLCNTHYTQESTPSEFIRVRAQLILSKAGALDPAIGRRFTAPNYEDWIRDVSAVLPQWDGRQVLADSVSWADLQEPVLGMIQALQGSLQLPIWGGIPDCGDDTAIPSADPIAPRPGESLITAFGRHAAGRGHDSRRTDPALLAASRRHTRKRKAFLAGPKPDPQLPDPGLRRFRGP